MKLDFIISDSLFHSVKTFVNNLLVEQELTLKVGAKVVFVKNGMSGNKRYYNGMTGYVSHFDGMIPVVRDDHTGELFYAKPVSFEKKDAKGDILFSVSQIPLKLAWALTIHKTQGMTLENVEIDAQNIFEDGQLYVALSRVKSSDGLSVKNFSRDKIKVSEECVNFYGQK